MSVVGVVLAAGSSQRMGFPKALATIEGETFMERAIHVLREGGCEHVLVVTSADEHVQAAATNAQVVVNLAPERGMLSSLQCAVFAAQPFSPDALVVSLLDHPRAGSETVRALIDARLTHKGWVVRPRFRGRRGHPFLLGHELFADIVAASPHTTTRELLSTVSRAVDLDVDTPGILEDIDTPEDLPKG